MPISKIVGTWLLFLSCWSGIISAAELTLADIQQQLSSHSTIRGQFTQTRSMAMFDQALTSNGQFLLSSQHGLWWQQSEPLAITLTLTQDKLRQQFAQQPAQIIKAQDNPMVFYFSHLFLSLFQGDTQALQQQFDIQLHSSQNQHWQLTLIPKMAPLNSVFNQITVSGQDYVEAIQLQEKRGDLTDIKFSNQSTHPMQLTGVEQRAFQF